ncbi:MAG: AAA family ATPase [Spirochaetales bacterium]
MILTSVTLHPFAGISDRCVRFDPGLSVVLGPNEAGKSTLFRAIEAVLLESSALTDARFQERFASLLPASGGDVLRVDLEALHGQSGRISLQKTWRPGRYKGSASLSIEHGGEYSDPETVQEVLFSLLPCSAPTMRSLLLSGQAGLHNAIQAGLGAETKEELGAVVRSAIMETGGISIERLLATLSRRHREYFDRWDERAGGPEGGRGIDRPWKRDVGRILAAYYEREELRNKLDAARNWEREFAAIEEQLSTVDNTWKEVDSAYQNFADIRDDVQRRGGIEQELAGIETLLSRIGSLLREWPVTEEKLEGLPAEREQLQSELADTEKRRKEAEEAGRLKAKRERASRVKKRKQELEHARSAESRGPAITDEQVEALSRIDSTRRELDARIEASSLSFALNSAAGDVVQVERVDGSGETLEIPAGSQVSLSADGQLTLHHAGLSVRVTAGDGELDEIVARRRSLVEEQQTLLREAGVETLEAARAAAAKRRELASAVERAQATLDAELEGEPLDAAMEPLETALPEAADADISMLYAREADLRSRIERIAERESDLRKQIAAWEEEFGSLEAMSEQGGDLRVRKRTFREQLASLPGLPEGFENADAFLSRVNELAAERERLASHRSSLLQRKAGLEATAPEESTEELQIRFERAKSRFERERSRGAALKRVEDRAERLREQFDRNTWEPLGRRFRSHLSAVTGDRFETVRMSETTPERFVTDNGTPLTAKQLSWGTRDSVSLALRMTLSEYAVGSSGGFVLLDDPLVDMDPDRRQRAAEAIRAFATKHQTIILTCHPEHAEALGGSTTALERST